MPYVVAIGHRLSIQDLLEKHEFEDIDEAECIFEEAGLSIFKNDSDDVFVTVSDKYRIIEDEKFIDLNLSLTEEEEKLLRDYTGFNNKRIKIFWSDRDDQLDEEEIFKEFLGMKKELELSLNEI